MTTIKLQSSDDEIYEVDINVAKLSGTIKNLVEDLGITVTAENDDDVIPLQTVTTAILKMVFEWAEEHKDDPPPAEDADPLTEPISEWDKAFVEKLDGPTLYEMITAANYLDVKRLLDLLCRTAANVVKTKNLDEIRIYFKIVNDFSPEEDEENRKAVEEFQRIENEKRKSK